MVTEIGRITKDVTVKDANLQNGDIKKVINNSIAIRYDKNNTTFLKFTAWGATAEFIARYFKKGSPIMLAGELRNEHFRCKAQDGEEKAITTVYLLVEKVCFVPGNNVNNKSDEEELF